MSAIDIDKLKEIREETAAGVMDVKKALEDAEGSVERAKEILREQGIADAKTKSDRQTPEGLVHAYIHTGGSVGAMIEVNCETDFVARTDVFKGLVHDLAMQVASMSPDSVEDLMEQDFIKDSGVSIEELVKSVIAKTGENVVIRRFVRYSLED